MAKVEPETPEPNPQSTANPPSPESKKFPWQDGCTAGGVLLALAGLAEMPVYARIALFACSASFLTASFLGHTEWTRAKRFGLIFMAWALAIMVSLSVWSKRETPYPTVQEIVQGVMKAIGKPAAATPAPPADTPKPQTNPQKSPRTNGNIEIFFGERAAGQEVKADSWEETQDLLTHTPITNTSAAMMIPVANNATDYDYSFLVRNNSQQTMKNITIKIASNRGRQGITPGFKILHHGVLEYDIPELQPYKITGQQETIALNLSTYQPGLMDETTLIVTVDGDTMPHPHSELLHIKFMPLPPQ
jgi:hypothetical protein